MKIWNLKQLKKYKIEKKKTEWIYFFIRPRLLNILIVIKLIRIKTYYFFTNNKALIIILNQVKKMKVTPIKYNLKLVPHKKKCHWKLKQVTENTNKYFKNIISIIIITGVFCLYKTPDNKFIEGNAD